MAPQLASYGAPETRAGEQGGEEGAVYELAGTTEKEVADEREGIMCFIAVSSGEGTPCPIRGRVPRMRFRGGLLPIILYMKINSE